MLDQDLVLNIPERYQVNKLLWKLVDVDTHSVTEIKQNCSTTLTKGPHETISLITCGSRLSLNNQLIGFICRIVQLERAIRF